MTSQQPIIDTMDITLVDDNSDTIDNNLERELERHFSSTGSPIELTQNEILTYVSDLCILHSITPPLNIYGCDEGCPVCHNNDYSSNDWTVLVPCGHLLCSNCINSINGIILEAGLPRKCPICRTISKWISYTQHNLTSTRSIGLQSNYNPMLTRQNAFNGLPYSSAIQHNQFYGLSRSASIAYDPYQQILDVNEVEYNTSLIRSIAPLNTNRINSASSDDIVCELSTRQINSNDSTKIGNLSIIAKTTNSNIGKDLILVLDVSGSMVGVKDELINIAKNTVRSLNSCDRLSIIVFDSEARQLFALQPMTSIIKNQAYELIDTCFTGGSTNLKSAIKLLTKVINDGITNTRSFTVIILSDGNPDNGYDGYDLVPGLYENEIKPEIFSCTFGADVKADVMKKLLTDQTQDHYKHLENITQFETLITENGLNNNVPIGTNLVIKLKNIKALTSSAKPSESDSTIIEIKFDQIKTNDTFNFPIKFTNSDDFIIDISYTAIDGTHVIVSQYDMSNENMNDFILHHYWYKEILQMIRTIPSINTTLDKLTKLDEIKLLSIAENLGNFYSEIIDLIGKTRLMVNNVRSNTHYNNYNDVLERQASDSSQFAGVIYRSASTNERTISNMRVRSNIRETISEN